VRLHYVLMGEGLGPVPEVLPEFARINETFRGIAEQRIREGMQSGEIRADADPKVEAVAFLALLRGTALQWLTDRGSFDLNRVSQTLQRLLRTHLAA
jgi:transcriptional regulator BetI-like protein